MNRNRTAIGVLAMTLTAGAALAGGCDHEASATHAKKHDIVDTAISAGSFQTLVTAVQAAGLMDTLKGDGPFTVFAPTDEAFSKLPAGTVESLLHDKEKLREILTYHVVSGEYGAKEVSRRASLRTLQGQRLPIDSRGGVSVGSATVVQADISTSNGVIHVIDEVLIPN